MKRASAYGAGGSSAFIWGDRADRPREVCLEPVRLRLRKIGASRRR
jgi:hypothetical protein